MKKRQGQTFLEYTIILGLLTVILFAMQPLIQRTIQAMVKLVADQVGNQEGSDQTFDETGHLVSSYSQARGRSEKTTKERLGITEYMFDDLTEVHTEQLLNLGVTEQPPDNL